jgi:3-dehydroquinate synthase
VQRAAGLAEAVKHGAIADEDYFALLEREHRAIADGNVDLLERVVARSVEIKAHVVARDEREAGVRAILNFGHTVGHAIEAVAKFEASHGEAVAAGMVVEARLGESLGITAPGTAQRLAAALERYGLPLALPGDAAPARVLDAMRHDKKSRDGAVRFALPSRVGAMHRDGDGRFTITAGDDQILAALGAEY